MYKVETQMYHYFMIKNDFTNFFKTCQLPVNLTFFGQLWNSLEKAGQHRHHSYRL